MTGSSACVGGRQTSQRSYGLPVSSIATLADLLQYLATTSDPALAAALATRWRLIVNATECDDR